MSAANPLGVEPSRADPLLARVLKLRRDLRSLSPHQVPGFELPKRFVFLSVLRPFLGIDAKAREPLVEFEQLVYELDDHRPPPTRTIADRIESQVGISKRACGTEYFSVFCPRGAGDIRLQCKRTDLLARANALMAHSLEA